MICIYVSRGDQYNNYDVTSARNIFQSSGHSKMVSNTSQTYPKYLISIASLFEMRKRISEHCPEETITTDVLERRTIDPKAPSAFSIDAAHAI